MNYKIIEFRVWDKEKSKFDINDHTKNIKYSLWDWSMSKCLIFPVDSYIFQQYTGLTDSKETEICEGDILKINYDTFGNVIGQVLYEADQGAYIFQWKRNGPNQNYINLNCDVAFESVIVGNIFENPELLK